MALGISLIALAALGTFTLVGLLIGATSDGSLEIAVLGSVSPQAGAALAAAVAVAATALLFLGLSAVMKARRHQAMVVHEDTRAREAEEEARARLLEMRLEQLQREVGELERRNDLLRPPMPVTVPAEPEPEVVVLPDAG